MLTLQRLMLPNIELNLTSELYYRSCDTRTILKINERKIEFLTGGTACFDTFFNSFSIDCWKENSDLSRLFLEVLGQGRFLLKIGLHKLDKLNSWIFEKEIALNRGGSDTIELDFWNRLKDGLVYVHLTALSEGQIYDVKYLAESKITNDVQLGIVITHYNRKRNVKDAAQRLHSELLSDESFKNKISLVIVDNSKNLDDLNTDGILVIPNDNFGGAGGFARGLLHLEECSRFTHCTFMDDDASCEIESIRRTYALLTVLNRKKTAISGMMLLESMNYLVYEAGGVFNGKNWSPAKHGLDARKTTDLLDLNLKSSFVNYGAWWNFTFKLQDIKYYPFPFFVRGDDVLFSIQNELNVITCIGIASLSDDFGVKESPFTRYLGARSALAINLLREDDSIFKSIKFAKSLFYKCIYSYNYKSANAINMAIKHVSSGPGFFTRNLKIDEIKSEIENYSDGEIIGEIQFQNGQDNSSKKKSSIFIKSLTKITLHGHLLPDFVFRRKIHREPKGFSASYYKSFRHRRILYYLPNKVHGYIATINRYVALKLVFENFCLITVFAIKFRKLKNSYRHHSKIIPTKDFWETVYLDNERS